MESVEVPAQLEALSTEQLQALVRGLAAERDELKKRKADLASPVFSAPPSAKRAKPSPGQMLLPGATVPTPTALTPAEVRKRVTALGKKCVREIKKTAHNDKRKPYTTVTEGMPKAEALQLLGDVGTKVSSTKKMDKISVSPPEIAAWLGIDEGLVHPVKFDGKVWSFGGQKPKVYAWAGFESLEVKVENNMITLKFRTYMAKTGRPGFELGGW
jgi:hypothetical protein